MKARSASGVRVVVAGLAATYPFGGVFWDYFQYVLGLHRLGHDVLYIEDTGEWCYDPTAQTFVASGSANAVALLNNIKMVEPSLTGRWFFRDALGVVYGIDWKNVVAFCGSADLFLHVSAPCWMREEYLAATRVAFIDSDPLYTQAYVPAYLQGTIDAAARIRLDRLRGHDLAFTFGENIGQPDCLIPNALFDWQPTRQPIVLDKFRDATTPVSRRRRVATTVASWEPKEEGPVIDGIAYRGKSIEFERFIQLPSLSRIPLEVAISGKAPVERLRANGWALLDGYEVSRDPWVYRDYLARSFAEWSVAKNAYVASRSGWFSCRTACYLALGVPAVVQDTGFPRSIPTGEGLFAFRTLGEAADALECIASQPERHARAALAIAEQYFDSDRLLTRLLDDALSSDIAPRLRAAR